MIPITLVVHDFHHDGKSVSTDDVESWLDITGGEWNTETIFNAVILLTEDQHFELETLQTEGYKPVMVMRLEPPETQIVSRAVTRVRSVKTS